MIKLSEKIVKARKDHRCDMCKGVIKKRDKYITTFTVDGGDWWTLKEHLKCHELRDLMCSECLYKFDCESSVEQCYYEKVINKEQG